MSYLETPDGLRLRITDRGFGEHAFVLVHGWKQSHRLWDPTITRLCRRHRVVAFDLRGMGESDKPNSRYDFDELACDLRHVLEALDLGDFTLVGWSMGCSVALQHLANDGSAVARLILVNGPIRLTRTADFPYAMTESQLEAYLDDMVDRWPLSEREFLADSLLEANPEHVDWLVQVALQTPLDIALRLVRNQATLDHRDVVKSLTIPLLALYSRHDPYYPVELADWIANTAPRGESIIFDRSAHCTPFEEPDAFCSALEEFVTRSARN